MIHLNRQWILFLLLSASTNAILPTETIHWPFLIFGHWKSKLKYSDLNQCFKSFYSAYLSLSLCGKKFSSTASLFGNLHSQISFKSMAGEIGLISSSMIS